MALHCRVSIIHILTFREQLLQTFHLEFLKLSLSFLFFYTVGIAFNRYGHPKKTAQIFLQVQINNHIFH